MKERGIRQTVSGWQVYVRVRGEYRSKHFPPETELEELKQWRDDQTLRRDSRPVPLAGTLEADVAAYLKARATMRSLADRTLHLEEWRDALGPRRARSGITPFEIRHVLEDWKATKKLSPASLNRRRTALMSLFSVLDPAGANPVRLVPRFREHPAPLQLPSRADMLKVIAAVGRDTHRKTRQPVLKGAKTRARLLVLAFTGWPAAQLMRLQRKDIHWKEQTALVRGRHKGTGTRDKILPLLPQAVAALREMDRLNAWGPFSTSAMHSSLTRTCKKLGVPVFHPYLLRHRFLADLAALTKDDRVVAELGMHTSPEQTRRYTESSVPERLTQAIALWAAEVAKVAKPRNQAQSEGMKSHPAVAKRKQPKSRSGR